GGAPLPVPADLRQHREPEHDQPARPGGPPGRPPASGQRGQDRVRLGGQGGRPGRPRPARDAAGELLIRGECLFSAYCRDPVATKEAFTDGGWYKPGAIARLTPDGYLYLLDRAKDMIISGGENIYPVEVEAVLARHPAVAEVAVIGVPDPTWGEAVHAVIRPTDGARASDAEIIAFCRDRLAPFQCPRVLEVSRPLPRTTTGKVLKRKLRARSNRNGVRR